MPRYRGGTPADDIIRQSFDNVDDLVDAGPGNDTVYVYEGNDTVAGGTGNDNILGAQGDDELHGDASVVLLPGGDFGIVQVPQSSSDRDFITGGDGNDFVYGESDDDVLFGGVTAGREDAGRDILNGGIGNDVLFGGAEPGAGATDNILGGDSGLLNFAAIVHAPGVTGAGTAPGEFVAPQYLESDIVQILRPAGAQLKFEYEAPGTFSSLLADGSTVTGGRVKVTTTLSGGSSSDYLYGVEYAKIYNDVGSLTADAGAYWSAGTPAARAAVFSPAALVPLTQWTFDIGRYANGTGILRLLRDGIEVVREDSSALATGGNLAATGAVCAFAWDDTTPIWLGTGGDHTFDAIYRVDGGGSRPDGPGVFELKDTQSMTGAGLVSRNNIQIHWSTSNDPPTARTYSSQGCYTINTSVIQAMERLVLAYGGQDTDQFTFKTDPGVGAAHDVIGGAGAIGSAGVTKPGESWLNLFWTDEASADPTKLVSQVQVRVHDLETIQQPKVVTTEIAALPGDKYLVTLGLHDGGDNKVSKAIRVFYKINGSGNENSADILASSGQATFTVIAPTLSSGGTPYLQVTGVSPINLGKKYDDFGPVGSDGRSRLMKMFFDAATKNIPLVPTVPSPPPLKVTPTPSGLDATLTDPAALSSIASLDFSGSYDSLTVATDLTSITMPPGLEALVYTGSTPATLVGTTRSDMIFGSFTDDAISGGMGADTLTGGGGVDRFTGTLAELDGDLISDFTTDDSILLSGAAITPSMISFRQGSTIISVDTNGDGTPEATFTLADDLIADGATPVITSEAGGTSISFIEAPPCFARGSRILTSRGEIPVECLEVGDLAVTDTGELRQVKWIGHRTIDCRAHPDPRKVWPIRVMSDAFGSQVPRRDLWLSPDHAVLVSDLLVPIRQLVNGTTIAQHATDKITYFHVELARHSILFAEGLPAESYLDTGNRARFDNGGGAAVLHPDFASGSLPKTWQRDGCAPLATDVENVRSIWQRLANRAVALGYPPAPNQVTSDPALSLLAAGRKLLPIKSDESKFTFALPHGVEAVCIHSRASIPADAQPWLDDRRCLGIAIQRIVTHDSVGSVEIPVDHPTLLAGWHDVERDGHRLWRWTDGDAILALPEKAMMVDIHLAGSAEYLVEPMPAQDGATGLDTGCRPQPDDAQLTRAA